MTLKNSDKMEKINMVMGNPISQSKSPLLHGQIYKLLKLYAVTVPVADSDVKKLVSKIRNESIGLTAVTMPFKKSVIPLLDRIDKVARKVKAINTIINKNGKLSGYNTDIDGVRYALRKLRLQNKRVLLLGAGGAGYAVAYVVRERGGKLFYLNRNVQESLVIQKIFQGRIAKVGELSAGDIDVIINATPVGMFPDVQSLSAPDKIIDKNKVVFDVVYSPLETKLLKVAKQRGAKTISGIDMFLAQGIKQIELWTGKNIINSSLVSRLKKLLIV